ncbi:hypothetical protein [Sorangium sp. So ce388]|uniref:hypothetical protein n=1 Tax=Sorangium sp. So ce388 TaxID=3133309 RepID=UPI003F5C618B
MKNHNSWLEALARAAREEDIIQDPRWDALAAGQLSPEDEAELLRLTRQSSTAAAVYEAFRPSNESQIGDVVERILDQSLVSRHTKCSGTRCPESISSEIASAIDPGADINESSSIEARRSHKSRRALIPLVTVMSLAAGFIGIVYLAHSTVVRSAASPTATVLRTAPPAASASTTSFPAAVPSMTSAQVAAIDYSLPEYEMDVIGSEPSDPRGVISFDEDGSDPVVVYPRFLHLRYSYSVTVVLRPRGSAKLDIAVAAFPMQDYRKLNRTPYDIAPVRYPYYYLLPGGEHARSSSISGRGVRTKSSLDGAVHITVSRDKFFGDLPDGEYEIVFAVGRPDAFPLDMSRYHGGNAGSDIVMRERFTLEHLKSWGGVRLLRATVLLGGQQRTKSYKGFNGITF